MLTVYDYAIEIPAARSLDADPSLVMTVMLGPPRRSMHTSRHRTISSNLRISYAMHSHVNLVAKVSTIPRQWNRVVCLTSSGSATIASYRPARRQKKVRLTLGLEVTQSLISLEA